MEEAFKDANCRLSEVMGTAKMEERTELLRANDHEGLKSTGKQCLARTQHKDWHCTEGN